MSYLSLTKLESILVNKHQVLYIIHYLNLNTPKLLAQQNL